MASPYFLFFCHGPQLAWNALLLRELGRSRPVHAVAWVIGEADRVRGEELGAFAAVVDLLDGYTPGAAAGSLRENARFLAELERRCGYSFYQADLAGDRFRALRSWSQEESAAYAVHLVRRMEAQLELRGAPEAAFGENNTLAYRLAHHILGDTVPYWNFSLVRHWDHRLFLDHGQTELWPECIALYREYLRSGVPEPLRARAAERLREVREHSLAPFPFRLMGHLRGAEAVVERLRLPRVTRVLREWWAAKGRSEFSPHEQTAVQLSPVAKLKRMRVEVQRKRYFDRIAELEVPAGRDYAVYFLQVQPEHSVEGMAFVFRNQLALIENLAAALPADVSLVVKEHRPMVGLREAEVHRRIKAIPNVVLVSDSLRSFDLIRNARAIFTLTGSSALEAMYLGVPAVMFGDLFYQEFRGIHKVESLKELAGTLFRVLHGVDDVATDEEVIAALAAMYEASYPGKWEPIYTDAEIGDSENLKVIVAAVEEGLSRWRSSPRGEAPPASAAAGGGWLPEANGVEPGGREARERGTGLHAH